MISSLNRTINTEENTVNTVIIITIIGMPISCRRVMTIIDFHTHVLPNMDDGSTGAEESVEMLEMMSRQGIKVVAATSHFDMRKETVSGFLTRREKALSLIEKRAGLPQIIPGAEVLCSGLPICFLEDIESLCIGTTKHILIETHLSGWTDGLKNEMLELMCVRGITPIIAHIERYCAKRSDLKIIRELKAAGAVLQMNASSFVHRSSRKRALRLLERENVDLICSDCHGVSVRTPNLSEGMSIIRQSLGDKVAGNLIANAQRIFEMGRIE